MKQLRIKILGCLLLSITACSKYLEKKPDRSLQVPSTLKDVQALMDNRDIMNLSLSCIGEAAADNYYMLDARYEALTQQGYKNLYVWEADIFAQVGAPNSWSKLYAIVYQANLALETLDNIPQTAANKQEWEAVRGSALFHRAKAFQQLVFTWAKAFDSASSPQDPGIPLRLNTNFNEVSVRASVSASYQQIIEDLKAASRLLPPTPSYVTRPSAAAAYAVLARNYLAIRQYDSCLKYAQLALNIKRSLVDYNTLNVSANPTFSQVNTEVIMDNEATPLGSLTSSRHNIDSFLIKSYDNNDLRKKVFFNDRGNGTYNFKGSYAITEGAFFEGEATDELYLMHAECNARQGNTQLAMDTLNSLLGKRWKKGTFMPFSAANPDDALKSILSERRKELLFRDNRWMDIKRLNKEGQAIVLKRRLRGEEYILQPNENRYALPLPTNVIDLSGMPQNAR